MDEDFPKDMLPCIQTFLAEDHTRPPGLDLYDDVFETPLFFPLQRKREMRRMIQTARAARPVTVMEIGGDKGGGLYHWCKCLPSVRRVACAEVRGTPYAALFERAFPHIDFLWLGSSYDACSVRAAQDWLRGDRIDVLFIDGDKSRFIDDFNAYRPLTSRKGVVFMHDVTDFSPREAFARAAQDYVHEEIVDRSEGEEAGRQTGPPAGPYDAWLRYWRGRSCGVGVLYMPDHPTASSRSLEEQADG